MLRKSRQGSIEHLEEQHCRALRLVDFFARVEQAFDLEPAELVKTFFPLDPLEIFFGYLGGRVDNHVLCAYIEEVFDIDLPHAELLPRLEAANIDFAKFYEEFIRQDD